MAWRVIASKTLNTSKHLDKGTNLKVRVEYSYQGYLGRYAVGAVFIYSMYVHTNVHTTDYSTSNTYRARVEGIQNYDNGGSRSFTLISPSLIPNSSNQEDSGTITMDNSGTISGTLYLEEYYYSPPSTPSSITVPTEVKGGESITISWGSSSGATGYILGRSVNGGTWTHIYSGSSRSYTDTITKGWKTVAYRVRAYNSDGYSGYRTSPTITVINFPEMQIKINGVLKTSDAGWVKINGQLREIDTIWVKINGAIKEVQ